MLERMDAAGIERAFLIAAKVGRSAPRAAITFRLQAGRRRGAEYPQRFHGLAGLDPTEGMAGVARLRGAVRDDGFIGAHFYPHWFELAPDHARWYPFYAKCVELDVPVQLQVGQSMVYDPTYPLRSVGRPITLDAVACDFPELKLDRHPRRHSVDRRDDRDGVEAHERLHRLGRAQPEVLAGVASCTTSTAYGQDKVLFGTDFPVLDFARAMRARSRRSDSSRRTRKLLRDNALRVYGLDGAAACNLADALDIHARARPTEPALIESDVTLTHSELAARVRRMAAWLVGLDLPADRPVGVRPRDTAMHVVALYALARAGIAILPMDVRWTVEEARNVAEHFGASLVLAEPDAAALPGLRCVTLSDVTGDLAGATPDGLCFPSDAGAPLSRCSPPGRPAVPRGRS